MMASIGTGLNQYCIEMRCWCDLIPRQTITEKPYLAYITYITNIQDDIIKVIICIFMATNHNSNIVLCVRPKN